MVTVPPVRESNIEHQATSEQSGLKVNILEAGKIGEFKNLSMFNKDQIVMSRRWGQRGSETAALVRCFRFVVVRTYQKCTDARLE